MTNTPKPITVKTRRIEDRSPIGTRYTDGTYTYTLVAYSIDPHSPRSAHPLFVDDDDLNNPDPHWFDRMTNGSLNLRYVPDILGDGRDEVLEVAPADPEIAARARAAAVKQYQDRPYRDTGELQRVMAFDDLTSDEELAAFVEFGKAELELRQAQRALERASHQRSERMARIVDLKGSQQAAARTLGANQSSVSRALRERPELP
jgi:hypothetical protein